MNKRFFAAATLAALAFTTVNTQAAEVLNDGKIIQVALTAVQSQIDASVAARSQATDDSVKKYAEKAFLDYSNHLLNIQKLQVSAGISPEASDTNKLLKEETDKSLQDIKARKGADFDRAFIDSQVILLQKFLDTINQALLPQVKNADLKTMLQNGKTDTETRLKEAKAIQTELNKTP